jgi:putative glutamine amidotransferase
MLTLISTHHEEINKNQTIHGHMAVIKDYVAFPILESWSTPLALPALPLSYEQVFEVVKNVDNVVLFGGLDIDPLRYGQEVAYSNVQRYQYRDQNEIHIVNACISLQKPLLGICRGAQLINVALGGTLYQCIKEVPWTKVLHMQNLTDDHQLCHHITIKKDSWLWPIFWGENGTVNSYHNQAVDKLAVELLCDVHSSDGIIEGYHHVSLPIYGVQWHPEISYHFDIPSQLLFKNFLNHD